jgi:hypothetical protein
MAMAIDVEKKRGVTTSWKRWSDITDVTFCEVSFYSEKPFFILAISHIYMSTTAGYQGYCGETHPAVALQTGRRFSSHLDMASKPYSYSRSETHCLLN